jgi:hypothetical protein
MVVPFISKEIYDRKISNPYIKNGLKVKSARNPRVKLCSFSIIHIVLYPLQHYDFIPNIDSL